MNHSKRPTLNIGVMRGNVERVFDPARKNHHWGAGSWRAIDDEHRVRTA
jgi:hypothetical protein